MSDRSTTRIAFWPFICVDILFLGLACFIVAKAHHPLTLGEISALIVCASLGAWSFLTPFLRRNAAAQKFAESDHLTNTVAQIKNLEQIATQIGSSSNFLKTALEQSAQTVAKSQQIGEKMAEESRAFAEFLHKANDTEKSYLRLEVEKLRRSEVDWIQVLVNILDQIFALHQAAVRSGKAAIIEQIGNFQIICRDIARRVGLNCVAADGPQTYDEKIHQIVEGQPTPEPGTPLEILALGYSYQGRIVRRALVRAEVSVEKPAQLTDKQSEEKAAEAQESLF